MPKIPDITIHCKKCWWFWPLYPVMSLLGRFRFSHALCVFIMLKSIKIRVNQGEWRRWSCDSFKSFREAR